MKNDHNQVVVSDRARPMLERHLRFLAKVQKESAWTLKRRFMEAFRSLESMPQRFPFLEDSYIPCNKYHKMYVENWFMVLYQIKDTIVYIDYIVDCRQDYGWLIK